MQVILGPLAKKLRQDKGLKQKEVALEIGTSSGNLCRFENGQQGLSLGLLEKLTKILGTTTNELLAFNSQPSEIQELAILMADLSTDQLAIVKHFLSAMKADKDEI